MDRVTKIALLLVVAVLLVSLSSQSDFAQDAAKAPSAKPPKALEEYSAYAALWRTDENFRSTIRISNQLATAEIDALPTIYIDIGELIRTQRVDQDQNVLPPDTHGGSLEVSAATTQPEDLATFVLAGGIYNPRKATMWLDMRNMLRRN